MKEFIRKHYDHIHGVLSCFDRMLFRGYLPIMSGWAMAQFLNGLDLKGSSLKGFLLESSERVKDHAIAMAQKHARPFQYLVSNIRKEDTARQLAERDGIEEGLVCVFEPCRTFSFCFQRGGPFVRSARRKYVMRHGQSPTRRRRFYRPAVLDLRIAAPRRCACGFVL
jgi:hypothetical protein